jgi:predicted acetylornithine/succinylornithine family transaminase
VNTIARKKESGATIDSAAWMERAKAVLLNNYPRFPVVIAKGKGCRVEDASGKTYLDFIAGIAVNSLGHCSQTVTAAIAGQMNELIASSNLYFNTPSIELAEALTKATGFSKVFFCNSGTEANEAALKLTRKLSKQLKGDNCTEVVSVENSFHGRTLGALSATGQAKHQKDFLPLLAGFKIIAATPDKLKEAISEKTSAIILEPVQGEGGVHALNPEFLKAVRQVCDEKQIPLIFDEIQCGVGRTGHFFAYEAFGIKPDAVTVAKGLGGGFPIGALLVSDKLAEGLKPGDHGSTFGGNPLACAVALAVFKEVSDPAFLSNVKEVGAHFEQALLQLKKKHPAILAVRGAGLIKGVELNQPAKPVIEAAIEKGLLFASAGPNVLRFLPPLTISKAEIDEGIAILDAVLGTIDQTGEKK